MLLGVSVFFARVGALRGLGVSLPVVSVFGAALFFVLRRTAGLATGAVGAIESWLASAGFDDAFSVVSFLRGGGLRLAGLVAVLSTGLLSASWVAGGAFFSKDSFSALARRFASSLAVLPGLVS